ncbi:MAG: hypothetical protein E7496_01885 [Ruminococcus sp.]|nr:hypothetical protein [Ruminococcus sp.]
MTEAEFAQKMKAMGWSDDAILEKLNFYREWTAIFLKDGFPPVPLENYLIHPDDAIYTYYGQGDKTDS